MKNVLNSALRCNRRAFAIDPILQTTVRRAAILVFPMVFIASLFTACKKEAANTENDVLSQSVNSRTADSEANAVQGYSSLPAQTLWELQQARAATARYRNIKNAIKDGYQDIAVDVEGMGHHFMKTSIVDGTFNIREPEILVYNKNHDGVQELVAVEYAVPLSYPMPEGFTGPADVWNGTSGFPFWLLHAWVWAYNPEGAFNWTNPQVHLH